MKQKQEIIDTQVGVHGPHVHKLVELEVEFVQEVVNVKESLVNVEMKTWKRTKNAKSINVKETKV